MKEKSWEKLHIEKDQEPFGIGAEKKVYQDKANPDRVIGMYKRKEISPEQAKARYYLTKILHIILPKNIPDVHLSVAKPNVIMRKKVELGSAHHVIREQWLKEKMIDRANEHHINRAMGNIANDPKVRTLKDKLFNAGVDVDNFPGNFGIDNEGNAQYIEDFGDIYFESGRFSFNEDKLTSAIEALPRKEREKALGYLEKVKSLIMEETKNLEKKAA